MCNLFLCYPLSLEKTSDKFGCLLLVSGENSEEKNMFGYACALRGERKAWLARRHTLSLKLHTT